MILQEKTPVSDFYGCPDAWGAVMGTIKAPRSGSFTHVTTFGHWIAAATIDSTVTIYDSITGAPRLLLKPSGGVRAITGSPDGSALFCAHSETSIIGWDIQTGGLTHTFVLEDVVKDIAICSNSCYLACGLWHGTVKVWEVSNKSEVATFGCRSPVTHLCWLEPGKQLVVASRESAEVWDVVARRVLRSFTMNSLICGVAYAQRLNKLAIATASESGTKSTITVVDPHTGTSFTHKISHRMSSLAFSPVTNEFVCSVGSHGVGLFSVPARSWRQFDHLSAITSISTLSNETVVANVEGSGIQVLSLDEGNPPPSQPITSTFTLDTLDKGNIIAVLPSNRHRDHIMLLEPATMSKIWTIPPPPKHTSDYSKILCASLKHHIVVHHFGDYFSSHCLRLWRFGDETPLWINSELGKRLAGGISPSGSRLVTVNNHRDSTRVRVWDVESGTCVVDRYFDYFTHPLEIRFESEDKLYSHHDTFLTPFTISRYTIIRHERLPPPEQSQRRYDVDDSHEWIVSSSKRVCWVPPGYIRSTEDSYCWAGTALIMAGHDGVLRKLTFREPS